MIATIVRVPHRILIGAGHLPGYLIPARGLLRANRHPVAAKLVKLTVYNRRPTIAQFDRRPAIRIKKIVAPTLNQAGRSECLDRDVAARHWNSLGNETWHVTHIGTATG